MNTTAFTEDKLVSKTDPFLQFDSWLKDATQSDPYCAKDACLASGAKDGTISSRFISMDSFSHDGIVFYTSTEGRMAKELDGNPQCAMTFYWPVLRRQIRIEGTADLLLDERSSEEYFRKLSLDKQIVLSVLAPHQSQVIKEQERVDLARVCEQMSAEYQRSGEPVPKPPFWKGYQITPTWIEFHQAHDNFFSDRLVFTRPTGKEKWELKRLAA